MEVGGLRQIGDTDYLGSELSGSGQASGLMRSFELVEYQERPTSRSFKNLRLMPLGGPKTPTFPGQPAATIWKRSWHRQLGSRFYTPSGPSVRSSRRQTGAARSTWQDMGRKGPGLQTIPSSPVACTTVLWISPSTKPLLCRPREHCVLFANQVPFFPYLAMCFLLHLFASSKSSRTALRGCRNGFPTACATTSFIW